MTNDPNASLWQRAEELAARNYELITSVDTLSTGEKVYVVINPELPGCLAHGQTLSQAMRELVEARTAYIYYLLVDNLDVPEPGGTMTTTTTNSEQIMRYTQTHTEPHEKRELESLSTRVLVVDSGLTSQQ